MGASALRGTAVAILSLGLVAVSFTQAQAAPELATVSHASAPNSGVRGDWSGDGTVDLIGTRSNGTLWMYAGTSTGEVRSGVQIGSGWTDFDWQGSPGDVNGDGHTDMLARRTNGTLWLYPGRGHGALGSGIQVGTGWSTMTAIATPGDFDLDGRPDLLARRSDGTLHLYHILATGGVRYVRLVGVGWNSMSSIIGMGDLNGDKRGDVVAVRQSDIPINMPNELWLDGTLFSFFSNGTRLLSARKVGGGWNVMTLLTSPGDMNKDGRGDLLARRADGTLWFYAGRTGGGVLPGRQVGSGWNGMLRVL
ncbi:MAG: VCBS repeat-containing protein [Actinomycetota bacterium]